MKVHVGRLEDSRLNDPADMFCGALAGSERFSLTDRPAEAEIIVFPQTHLLADWRLRPIRDNWITRSFLDRTYVYNEQDHPWCALPGVYTSMPARDFQHDLQRAWGYYRIDDQPALGEPDLLCSLVASPTARCREELFQLRHSDAIIERVDGFVFYDPDSRDFAQRQAKFRAIVHRSHFVLCPRGAGTSSIRLFETLSAGRVPVIISDDWVPPAGVDWGSCSVRWPEHQTEGLFEHLEGLLGGWGSMADAARQAYLENFSPFVSVERILTQIVSIHSTRQAGRHSHHGRAFAKAGARAMTPRPRVYLGRVRRQWRNHSKVSRS